MPVKKINGINLSFDDYGAGAPVLLVAGSGAPGRVWRAHQVPALMAAGFRAITLDNRGIPPTDECPAGFTLADMVADTAGLIEFLEIGPCRVVGFSLGAIIVQELLTTRPELVTQAVLIATRGRTDALSAAVSIAEIELIDSRVRLPPRYAASVRAIQGLSPHTLNDEQQVRDWLDTLELASAAQFLNRAQLQLDMIENRLDQYKSIDVPCLIIGFRDDRVAPPHLCREVADSIPGSMYCEIENCGHYGYLERPDTVNSAIISFLRDD